MNKSLYDRSIVAVKTYYLTTRVLFLISRKSLLKYSPVKLYSLASQNTSLLDQPRLLIQTVGKVPALTR